MKGIKIPALTWLTGTICLGILSLFGTAPGWAQTEKRTVFTDYDFHWQGHLKAGQTLEVINRNGQIQAIAAAGDEARAQGIRRGNDDDNDLFIEVVEYPDGVTICAVHAKDKTPGRCHRGGVSSESSVGHQNRAKINFDVQVPQGVLFHALTTNASVLARNLASVVEAATTNGDVEVSTSEWASASNRSIKMPPPRIP